LRTMAPPWTTPPLVGHNEAFVPGVQSISHASQLLAGPLVMAVLATLQLLKRKLTGAHASRLYKRAWAFLSKAEARDKVGKIAQYGCRFLQGALAHAPADFALQPWKPIFAEAQTTLAWARRTNRWGKEMPHITALGEAVSNGEVMEAVSRTFIILYLVQDHIYWLLKVGILKFRSYTPIQWHRRNLKFVLPSYVLNFVLCWRNIRQLRERRLQQASGKGSVDDIEQEIYDNKRMMVRYTLTFIQILHVSKIKDLDDWYVGIMGMISSYIDASKQW